MSQVPKEDGEASVNDLVPIFACCCHIAALYCPPACSQMIGCFGQYTCLCIEQEYVCCKPSEREGDCCICAKNSCLIISPKTCVSGKAQCFCIDGRCALPCIDEIPCAIAALGLTCCLDWSMNCGCCQSIGNLRPQQVPPPK